MASLEVGKVQIYTGDGKGKTTAALGLAMRATGYGLDVLILDELGEAMCRGFVTREDVEALIAIKPATTELVLTGRGLLPLADLADLVTEMRPVKHYFDEGLLARQGIEY